jgi:type I restriction enzyme S subunit
MEIQEKIASICGMIDEKIHLNIKINNNLLEQAQAIFSNYYDRSISQQPFTSLIHVLGGGTPKTGNPDYWNGSIPFFTPKDVGIPYTFHTEKFITESGLEKCNSRLYPKNTSFVTARGTVGKVSLAGQPMAMNQSCYALKSDTIDSVLVYFYVLKAVSSLKNKASGAVFDAIVTRDFETEVINVLSSEDSQIVLDAISPMMEKIHNNTKENIRLSALRDALLPRLMSGELDVSGLDL